MRAYAALVRAGLSAFRRDRQGMFWTFFFPVMFIIIFGLVFSERGERDAPKFAVGIVAPDRSPQAAWAPEVFKKIPAFKVTEGGEAKERAELQKGNRRVVVVFPPDFGRRIQSGQPANVRVLFDPSQQMSQQTAGIVRQVLAGMDQRMSGRSPLLTPKDEPVLPGQDQKRKPRAVDFLIPGILAMSIMQLGLFTAIPIINMREKGILKRFSATPLPRTALVASQITQRLVISLMQTALLLGLGAAVFHFRVAGSWLLLIGVVVIGVLTFITIGALLSSVAKTQESGMSLVQLVNFPMMFLSGVFFPPEIMPGFIKPITAALPATYLADAIRHVALAAPSAHSLGMDVGIMAAWLVVCAALAARVFRWD